MSRRVGLLMGGTTLVWATVAYPAWRLGGSEALVYSTVAAVLCLMPTVATLLLAAYGEQRAPNLVLLLVLGGSGLRMAVVLGIGLAICLRGLPGLPPIHVVAFWIWVLVFYLVTLILEITLLLTGPKPVQRDDKS